MVQIIEQKGDIAGRIGKGFGKGLAEQLPKEIERNRLSSGLKRLGEQDLSGKNQLSTLADIYSIPGMTPEIAALAQQQIQKQNFLNKGNVHREAVSKPRSSGLTATPREIGGFASPEQISEYKSGILQEPSFEEEKALADDYLQQGLTQNPQEALVMAKNELRQNKSSQEARNSAFRTDLNDRLRLSLQGQGLGDFKDIAGKIQTQLLDQGEYMVNVLGVNPQVASEKLEKIGYDMGLALNNLKDTGSFWNMFRPSKDKTSDLRSAREPFEKYGFGELFDDQAAATLRITPLQLAHEVDPLKNEGIKEDISALKRKPSGTQLDEKTLDRIIRQIKPRDNLFAIEYELRQKGYDVNQFKERVRKLAAERDIVLTDQQKRQQKRTVRQDLIGDLLYQSF